MTLNPNQFAQTAIPGSLDLAISQSGIISGQVSANQGATKLYPGDPVTLDTTSGFIPQFLGVAVTATAKLGIVCFSSKQSSFTIGDRIEVALLIGVVPVMYMTSAAAIAVLAAVEDAGSETVQTQAAGKQLGLALDPATASGQLIRIMLTKLTLGTV